MATLCPQPRLTSLSIAGLPLALLNEHFTTFLVLASSSPLAS